MPKQSAARRIKKAVRKRLGPKLEGRKEGLARRAVRKWVGPKQTGLKPAFKDGSFLHSQVRVGKRGPKSDLFPKGKPKAIVFTKIRTMKKGAHKDYGKAGRNKKQHLTRLGKLREKRHGDELPQLISLLKRKLKPVGWRPLLREEYNMLPPKLKRIYDEVGPGVLPISYACKAKEPTIQELVEVAEEFYDMWKKNKWKAYWVFGRKALKGSKGREIDIREVIKRST